MSSRDEQTDAGRKSGQQTKKTMSKPAVYPPPRLPDTWKPGHG